MIPASLWEVESMETPARVPSLQLFVLGLPASLWEVESMETPSRRPEPSRSAHRTRFPLGSGINGNTLFIPKENASFPLTRFPLGSGINGNAIQAMLISIATTPASLWEVESMETVVTGNVAKPYSLTRFPLGSGINGNHMAGSPRARCRLHPLPSGKWNQWKLSGTSPNNLIKKLNNPLPSGKWNQWKLAARLPLLGVFLPASLWEVESMETGGVL